MVGALFRWVEPDGGVEPNERARRLAEIIAETMNVTAFVLIVLVVVVAVGVPWFIVASRKKNDAEKED
jgi:hypothetical protein